MISAGGPSLYKGGKGCGACYQIKCRKNAPCSGKPVTVIITDECAGCTAEAYHFDLSGTAFGAMSKPGQSDKLIDVGLLQLDFRRVPCKYGGVKPIIHIDSGANPYYFACSVQYAGGDGSIAGIAVKSTSGSDSWHSMEPSWGTVWCYSPGSPLEGSFSIRLTSGSGKQIVAKNAIPDDWQPGKSYKLSVNF